MSRQEKNSIVIKKASGDTESFDANKLKRSLQNAGANDEAVEGVVTDIEGWIYEGVSTKDIYSRAFSLLRKKNNTPALRYKLKQALFEFGPTGFPFEHFIGEIFKRQGYQTEVGQVISGLSNITHEMDVIATNSSEQKLIECKFGRDQGKLVRVQVPLYVHSRIEDIVQKRQEMTEYKGLSFSGGIVTNTRFSSDSIEYSKFIGIQLLGWDYPMGNGLKDIIEKEGIFPITLLNHLTLTEKQLLLNMDIVICSQLLQKKEILDTFGLSKIKYQNLLSELEGICNLNLKSEK